VLVEFVTFKHTLNIVYMDHIYISIAAAAPFPAVKRPGPETNHSPSSNTQVKNAWSYTSTPP